MANPFRTGLTFGVFLAAVHALWSAFVALGFAQKLIDFVFWAHFVSPSFHIEAFDWARAAILIGVAFGIGFVAGMIIAMLWNLFERS